MQTFVLSRGRQEVHTIFWDYLLPELQNVTDLVMRGGSVPYGGRGKAEGGVGGGGVDPAINPLRFFFIWPLKESAPVTGRRPRRKTQRTSLSEGTEPALLTHRLGQRTEPTGTSCPVCD